MSRQELAEAVNRHVFVTEERVSNLDGKYVGKLERGEYRWPSAASRRAFRAVLGVSADADVGFYITRRPADDSGTGNAPVPARRDGPGSEAKVPTLLRRILAERHWQTPRTFRAQFLRAATELADQESDPTLRTMDVSVRQFRRWLYGVRPRPDACRVLEHMFGVPIDQLLGTDSGESVVAPRAAAKTPTHHRFETAPLAAVQLTVPAGMAVTVVCHDNELAKVVAGPMRVLVEVPGDETVGSVPSNAVVEPSAPQGARIYSIADRQARGRRW
jgi:hypothetical protein